MKCSRCGRSSHTVENCYAKSDISGGEIIKKHFVYSLNLEGGRKYVGKTDNIKRRLDEHYSGNGATWTKKYKPISVNHVQVCKSSESQAKAETIVYNKMASYHGSGVRGAWNTSSGCSRCGRESHKANRCYAKTHENGNYIEEYGSESEYDY